MRQLSPIQPVPPIARDMDLVANRLPSTEALSGRTVVLEYEAGASLRLEFTRDLVRWAGSGVEGGAIGGTDPYDAVEIRPGVFYCDFVAEGGNRGFTHVIDLEAGRALTVWNEVRTREGAKDLHTLLRPARVGGHAGTYRPVAETRDLLGRRLFCEYSGEAALEHIYTNSGTIVWQWLRSPPAFKLEVGIEAATTWKIGEELYLLASRGVAPITLLLLLDMKQMRNVGRLFGTTDSGPVDRRCGAKITFLGRFSYPDGYEPG